MNMMAEHHFTVPEETRLEIFLLMTKIHAQKDRNFGNGRTARNVFEAIEEHMAHRLSDADLTREELTTVLPEDVPDAAQFTKRQTQQDQDGQSRDAPGEPARKIRRRSKRKLADDAEKNDGRNGRV